MFVKFKVIELLTQLKKIFSKSWPFRGSLSAIMGFAGGAALQAVSECQGCCYSSIFLLFDIFHIVKEYKFSQNMSKGVDGGAWMANEGLQMSI